MTNELRKSGLSLVGDAPWGTHFCHFYETKQDLLDTLVPYFKAGLESKEFCLWVVSNTNLITFEDAKGALAQAVPDLDRHFSDGNIEILNGLDWYLEEGLFNLERVTNAWDTKLKRALARGYDGMRVSEDTYWLREKDRKDFWAYEKQLNDSITDQPITLLCTYPLAKSGATEVLDVAKAHQFAIARRRGEWEVIESPELIRARGEIKELNEELEQRVIERTNELRLANEELTNEINERKRAEALLHSREQEFRAIVENAPDHIIRYDRNFRRTYINPAVAKYYGLPAEAMIGKPIGSVIEDAGLDVTESALAEVRQRIADVFDTGQSYEYELIWPMPAGLTYFSVRLFPELDLDGSVVNVLGISRDITERRNAEEELKKEKEILEKVFDNIPVMIGFVGDNGRIKLVNSEWERTIGWTLKELQEQNVDIFAEAYPDLSYRQEVLDFVAASTGEWVDLKIKVRDGRLIYAACAVVHLSDGTKIAIARDITERKLAEAALRESEERFRQMAENIREVFWMCTADLSKTLYISPAYEVVWGRSRESLYRDLRSVFAAIHPADRVRAVTIIEAGREQGFEVEYRVVRPDGSIRWIWDRGFPIRDESGRSYRLAGIAEDITERKQAEDALRRSDDHLRLVINTIPTMAWSIRPDGSVDFVNQRWMDYTGLSLEEESEEAARPIHPEDVPRVMERWLVEKAVGEPYEDEMRLRRADGVYRWFLVRNAPLRDEWGDIVKWYGASIDIEDRKRAEERLKQRESQLTDAQRLAHVGSFDWDLRSNAVTWSEELYRIFGLQPESIKVAGDGMPSIHPDDRDLVRSTVNSSLKNQEPYSIYYRALRPNGDERIVQSHGHIVSDDDGNPIKVVGATQDVTELKRAEEKLKATSEQLRALSAHLQSVREEEATRIAREIHDELGSVLTRLKWDLELLSKERLETRDEAEGERLGQRVEDMIQLVGTTIETVRRISAELRPSVLDDLGLAAALRFQLEQFQDRTGILTGCDCGAEDLELNRQQSTAVFRVFEEALTNIMRHAGATRVAVRLEKNDADITLKIRDNGRGITEDQLSDHFSLGLLGMRERVHLIGGEISIAGIEGRGTSVTVRLPRPGPPGVLGGSQ